MESMGRLRAGFRLDAARRFRHIHGREGEKPLPGGQHALFWGSMRKTILALAIAMACIAPVGCGAVKEAVSPKGFFVLHEAKGAKWEQYGTTA